jgi:hypothetical protein
MFTRISQANETWFRAMAQDYDRDIPQGFPRVVVILHPGTYVVDDPVLPFRAPNANDVPLSEEQTEAFEQVLLKVLGPKEQCCVAFYAGYLRPEGIARIDTPEMTWVSGRLAYLLLQGELNECLFSAVETHWDPFLFLEVSYLWATDRSWVIALTPDTAHTVIGCDDALAEALLQEPQLKALDWTGRGL